MQISDVVEDERYGRYLADLFEYSENSPTCLVWKNLTSSYSRAAVGTTAGGFDKTSGYATVNLATGKLRVNKIVWALFNNFQSQEGLYIDHIDLDKSNNKITNLRAVDAGLSARNKPKNKNNSSGYTGVSFSEGFTAKGTYYSKYTAWVWLNNNKKAKTYSIQKWGEELAQFLAVEWREQQIALLNLAGAGYTERHGV
jgi:hypothetical protein